MAMINTIIYANLLPFVSLIIFLVFILHNPVFDKKQAKLFFLSASITLIMIAVVSLDYILFRWSDLNLIIPSIYILRRFTSFLNFAFSPIIPLIVYHIYATKKAHFALYTPAIANTILCFISIFCNLIFFIETNNSYDRGPLFFIPFITTIFYLGAVIVQRGHSYTKSKRTERLFLLFVVFLLGFSMYLEVAERFLFLTWDFTAICLILYYLLLSIHQAIIDPLTSTYNRLAYNYKIEKMNKLTTGIIALIDINDFKDINDLQGHDVGDIYLQDFAILLEQAFSTIGNIYRIGGDEFILLSKKTSNNKFEACLKQARELAQKKNMSFACGWKVYTPDQLMSDFIVEIDQLMYADKRALKQ